MDELSTAVLLISSTGEIQMANKQVHHLFGYKKGERREVWGWGGKC
jgi:hypothetical protein